MSRPDDRHSSQLTNKFGAFFRHWQWKEVAVFLMLVVLSTGLWYLQALQEDYEIDIVLPVMYKNIPSDMALTADNPETITVRVRDKGMVLLNYIWARKFKPVEVDMGLITNRNKKTVLLSQSAISQAISRQLQPSTSVLSFDPQTIQAGYSELHSKVVPVQADIELQLKQGYQLADSIRITPSTIRIYGRQALLDSVKHLKTLHTVIEEADGPKQLTLRIQDIGGIRYETNKVDVNIPIDEFIESRFTLPIQFEDVPTDYTLRVFPSAVEVICHVPRSRFKELTAADLELVIPFSTFESARSEGKLPAKLSKKPDWLAEPTLLPDIIEFILEQNQTQ